MKFYCKYAVFLLLSILARIFDFQVSKHTQKAPLEWRILRCMNFFDKPVVFFPFLNSFIFFSFKKKSQFTLIFNGILKAISRNLCSKLTGTQQKRAYVNGVLWPRSPLEWLNRSWVSPKLRCQLLSVWANRLAGEPLSFCWSKLFHVGLSLEQHQTLSYWRAVKPNSAVPEKQA